MILKPGELHLRFDDTANRCTVYQQMVGTQVVRMTCEMRNEAVRRWFGKWGWCPRGTYLVGSPSRVNGAAFGEWFTPLFDTAPDGPMHKEGRSGIGIHGGGTGLPDPFAPNQGWKPTHGCLRVQNIDNTALAMLVRSAQQKGYLAFLTVSGKAG